VLAIRSQTVDELKQFRIRALLLCEKVMVEAMTPNTKVRCGCVACHQHNFDSLPIRLEVSLDLLDCGAAMLGNQ
jgi:hypothetical protein